MSEIKIGWAQEEEWSPTMRMVWRTFLEFEGKEYSPAGIRDFFGFITDDRLYQGFLRGTYQVMVARDGENIVGMGSIRNGNFLSLLFVSEEYQHRAIGSCILDELMAYLKTETEYRLMTVKAAPPAVPFYQKKGFYVTGETENYNGVYVVPMEVHL